MGFHVLVRGSMKLDPDRFSGWRRGKVSPKKFADWKEHSYANADETPSVATLLERYASWLDPADHEYLRLVVKGEQPRLRAAFQLDDCRTMPKQSAW